MRLAILFEDLDDKDSFELNCYYCSDQQNEMLPNIEEFHTAHIAARELADKAGAYGSVPYKKAYEDYMYTKGFKYRSASLSSKWVKAT